MIAEHNPTDAWTGDWPERPWLTAALFGVAGLAIHALTYGRSDGPWQMAGAAFVLFAALAAGFTVERARWREPALFALGVGVVMAGLAWRAVQYGDALPDEEYGFAAGAVACGLALPLFQAQFHRRLRATPYADVFGHIWNDAITAAGALAFTGLSWLVLVVLSELFHLLKLDFLRTIMNAGWFEWIFSGVAAGAALGTLRNQARVIGTLQTVVLLVVSLLAVPLAVGLTVFLGATAVSGPQVLWEATRSATPVLLACAAGAFVMTSAILRHDDAAMTRNRALRIAALVLAVVVLPLAVFAAVSMGLRLAQYGLAPERLWGLVAIVVACAWGLGYWVALARGRRTAWTQRLREANLNLAVAACGLALLLALPVLDFGRLSAADQVRRLEAGRVTADHFDFAALRWDFGASGRRALSRLAGNRDPRVAELARAALAQKERSYRTFDRTNHTRADFNLRTEPGNEDVRRAVLDYLVAQPYACQDRCVALDIGEAAGGGRRIAIVQSGSYESVVLKPDGAIARAPITAPAAVPLGPQSRVEVGETRAILVDGKPVGPPLE